ncbi:MAG: sugar nucleotide-binding protein, partial [Proteobacteria bacterium]|nr:sugar nucleotide-binding protein [Pseudomonadota bacterium]
DGYVVRTSWLFGDGANFVATMLRLFAERPEVKVVGDQTGRPTFAPDLAAALVELCLRRPPAGVYHFANAGETTWYGLAAAAHAEARARGRKADATLTSIATADYPTPARRPRYSVLATTKLERALGLVPRPWREALASYFDLLEATP